MDSIWGNRMQVAQKEILLRVPNTVGKIKQSLKSMEKEKNNGKKKWIIILIQPKHVMPT